MNSEERLSFTVNQLEIYVKELESNLASVKSELEKALDVIEDERIFSGELKSDNKRLRDVVEGIKKLDCQYMKTTREDGLTTETPIFYASDVLKLISSLERGGE